MKKFVTAPWRWALLSGGALFVVAVLLIVLSRDSRPGQTIGALMLAAGVVLLHFGTRVWRPVRNPSDPNPITPGKRKTVAALVVAAFAIAGLGWLARKSDAFIALAILALMALGLAVSFAREWFVPSRRVAVWSLVGAVALLGVGAANASHWFGKVALVLSVFAIPICMGMTSEAVLVDLVDDTTSRRWLPISGAIAMLIGVGELISAGAAPLYAGAIGLVVALLVLAITANVPGDVIVVSVVILATFPLATGSVPVPAALTPSAGEHVVVAIGDSYMSGEGASTYYTGTNLKSGDHCRRAPTAYAPRLFTDTSSSGFGRKLVFLACSGATAQTVPGKGSNTIQTQIDKLRKMGHRYEIDMILVSIGGNDALFGDIAQACVGPGDCSTLGDSLLAELNNTALKIRAAYTAIDKYAKEFAPGAPVLVLPYPLPVAPHGCSWSAFSTPEHEFLGRFTRTLDGVIQDEVTRAHFVYVAQMVNALDGLRICDSESPGKVGVNQFALKSVQGLVSEQANPKNWGHNSMHPKPNGHEALAAALRPVVARYLADPQTATAIDQSSTPAPPPLVTPPRLDPRLSDCGRPSKEPGDDVHASKEETDRLGRCTSEIVAWSRGEAVQLALRGIIPLLFIIGGGWALWLSAIAFTRKLKLWVLLTGN